MSTRYAFRIKQHHGATLSAWFDDFTIVHTPDGESLLIGPVADQAALYGVITRCRDLGVTLISFNPLPEEAKHMSESLNWIHAEASLVIHAHVDAVYAVISDYHVGHPAILPSQFKGVHIEQGGKGAGTIIRGYVQTWGRKVPFHHLVTEPEPGRLLVETDIDSGQFTRFIFEPLESGAKTRVTFASDFPPSPGLMGVIERLTIPGYARGMYRAELNNLAEYVRGKRPN